MFMQEAGDQEKAGFVTWQLILSQTLAQALQGLQWSNHLLPSPNFENPHPLLMLRLEATASEEKHI